MRGYFLRLGLLTSALIVVAIGPVTSANGQTNPPTDDPFRYSVSQVSDDIYVAFRPEPLRYIVEGNVTIIVNDTDVVVVDATGSPIGATDVINAVQELTDKPVRLLVNTHGHGDHTLGNHTWLQAYPGLEIVAHPGTYDYLTAESRGINYVHDIARDVTSRREGLDTLIQEVEDDARTGYEAVVENLRQYRDEDIFIRQAVYRDITIAAPTILVSDSLLLRRKNRDILIFHPGKGDTASDLWVYLPDDRIIISGDAVVHPIPYGFSRYGAEWLETLQKVYELDFQILIPGHGDVQYGKAYLEQYIDLLSSISNQMRQAINDGKSREEVIASIDVDGFRSRFAGEDPVLRFYFDLYFLDPHRERLYDVLTR